MQRDRIGYSTFCLIWDGRPAKLVPRSYGFIWRVVLEFGFVVIYTLIALIVIDNSIVLVQFA